MLLLEVKSRFLSARIAKRHLTVPYVNEQRSVGLVVLPVECTVHALLILERYISSSF